MLEYYVYHPVTKKRRISIGQKIKYTSVADIKKQLSESMVAKLLPPPNKYCVTSLYVEVDKVDVVKKLDETWLKRGQLSKAREIEVTKDEIDGYDYFFVDLKNIDWGNHVLYDFDKPLCSHETCPWGAKITSEIKVKDKSVRRYDFVKISEIWGTGVTFLISNRIKKLFDENDITGLSYGTCELVSPNESRVESKYFIAKIITSYKREASDIKLRDYCKQHSIIIDATPINARYPIGSMSNDDFQMLDKIAVDNKEYTFRSPWFFISRKALRILLDNGVKDLKPMTLFTKNGFRVAPFDR